MSRPAHRSFDPVRDCEPLSPARNLIFAGGQGRVVSKANLRRSHCACACVHQVSGSLDPSRAIIDDIKCERRHVSRSHLSLSGRWRGCRVGAAPRPRRAARAPRGARRVEGRPPAAGRRLPSWHLADDMLPQVQISRQRTHFMIITIGSLCYTCIRRVNLRQALLRRLTRHTHPFELRQSPQQAAPITAHTRGARRHFRIDAPLGRGLGCGDRQAVEWQRPTLVHEHAVDEAVPGHQPLVREGL